MSSESSEADTKEVVESKQISFADFLAKSPPGVVKEISDLRYYKHTQHGVSTPDVLLYCGSDTCGGPRLFRHTGQGVSFSEQEKNVFFIYTCKNCGKTNKTFALMLARDENFETDGLAVKYGEVPLFGPRIPKRLRVLLGADKALFFKGFQCEIQGQGLGAFAYYRRVVENQKDHLIGEIIKVAEKLKAGETIIAALQAAKNERKFSNALSMVKDAIPDALKINGHNPLAALHAALSDGLHGRTDEECLELATDVRLVMEDLAERLSVALAEDKKLNTALARLMNRRAEKEKP